MDLKDVLQVMEQLAPLSLAESWDNVGLLVEPSKCRPIKTILLTNDLTVAVMEEAEAMICDLIVSYHPPLFRPIKRLVQKDWKQLLAVRAIESGMAIFSPHTSWDSVKGGVNDWLVGGLGKSSFEMENHEKFIRLQVKVLLHMTLTYWSTMLRTFPLSCHPMMLFVPSLVSRSGSGQVSVLSQALSSSPSCHKLEFTVRSTEELDTVMEELKTCNSGAGLQHTSCRLFMHKPRHTQTLWFLRLFKIKIS